MKANKCEAAYPKLWDAVAKALKCCKDHYAQTYLAVLAQTPLSKEAIRQQLMYALKNMQLWQGEEAREVKKVFREYIESLKGDSNEQDM